MRTELQKKFLSECGIDPEAEGQIVENLFTYPKYKMWVHAQTNKKEGEKDIMGNPEMQQQQMSQPAELNQQAVPAAQGIPSQEYIEPSAPTNNSDGFGILDNAGEVKKKTFDPSIYIGKDSFIEFIEERKGQYGYYIKLYSQTVDSGEIEIRASCIFGLDEDNEGKIGWAPDSKLYNFLRKNGVNHYRDLLLNPVTQILKDDKGDSFRRISGGIKTPIKIQTRQAKDGKEYLTF